MTNLSCQKYKTKPRKFSKSLEHFCFCLFLVVRTRIDVQPKTFGIQVQLVLPTVILEELSDVPGVLDPPKLDVALALLDGFSDKLS